MKRKRGSKLGKNSTSNAAATNASPKSQSSPSTEENSPTNQEENAPVTATPVPEPPPSEPEKPGAAPANPADIPYAKPKVGAVYGRVKLKFKSYKVLVPHQTSSEAQTPTDAGKSGSAVVPEASKQVFVEKATVLTDGPTDGHASELSGSDRDRGARKVASIKIKSAGLSLVEDNTQDRIADSVDEPLPSKQDLENEESENALEPSNSQELDVKQSTSEHQRDEKELTAALEAIKKVMTMDAAEPFNIPVDPVALGIPDYFDIIDTPMDFGTICQDLERGNKYMNSEDVYKDVQFIWDNCTKYNSKGDYIIELMKRVKKAFMKNWLAAGLYSDVQENGGNDNTGDEDAKGNSKSRSKNKRRRLGNDRHKNDCACAVCQVTRRKKERDEILAVDYETAVMNSNISDQHNMEVNSGVNNPGSHDTASSQDQPPQTDVYEESMEADDTRIQMGTLGKLNNRPSNFPPPDYEDEGSRQYSEEKEEVEYKDMNSQEEHTSTQPNDDSEVTHHQQKTETSQEVEMKDYSIQQENHSFLQLFVRLFPSNQSSVFRGRHSLFRQQRQVSLRESPLHAAMTAIMKR